MTPDVVLPTHWTRFVTVTFGLSLFTVHIPSHSMPVSLSESKSFEIEHVVDVLTLTPLSGSSIPLPVFPISVGFSLTNLVMWKLSSETAGMDLH